MMRTILFRAVWGWVGLSLMATMALGAGRTSAPLHDDPAVQQFIQQMVEHHGFDRAKLEALFAHVQIRTDVLAAMSRPAEAKPWYEYRAIFLTPSRIAGGARFWRAHEHTLARAQQVYGVDPAIIVAILGVETRYGGHTGSIPVVDALATLAFRYPPRAAFFRGQLEQYLLLTREEHLDPLALDGSYAGAMGLPQFIASSYRRYAVDFDGDHVRNLLGDVDDAIGSVANYLAVHGWRRGGTVAVPAQVSGDDFETLLKRGLKPRTPIATMQAHGVRLGRSLPASERGALIDLQGEKGSEYWVGLQNFYTITRYNHSALYAMAVYQLAQAIRARHARALTHEAMESR